MIFGGFNLARSMGISAGSARNGLQIQTGELDMDFETDLLPFSRKGQG